MKKVVSIILILVLSALFLIGCGQKTEMRVTSPEDLAESDIISIAIKLDSEITNETLDSLRAQGIEIEDFENSEVYGNVVFGTINKSKIGNLSGEVQEGVDEREYKTEVLTKIAITYDPSWEQNKRDLGLLVQSQIVTDEKKEEQGITGPIISDLVTQKFEDNNLYVSVNIIFKIEAWQSWENYTKSISSDLGEGIKVELANWRGVKANITKEGVEKLKDDKYLKGIYWRNSDSSQNQ